MPVRSAELSVEEVAMTESEDFLRETMPRLVDAEATLHQGDVAPRLRMWSEKDPVTVFGAWSADAGWQDVSELFRGLASRFSNSTSYDIELIGRGCKWRLGLHGRLRTQHGVGRRRTADVHLASHTGLQTRGR